VMWSRVTPDGGFHPLSGVALANTAVEPRFGTVRELVGSVGRTTVIRVEADQTDGGLLSAQRNECQRKENFFLREG